MGEELKGVDFFEKNFLKNPIKSTETLSKAFEILIVKQKEIISLSKVDVESNALKLAQDFEALNKQQVKIVEQSEQLSDIRKTEKKTLSQVQKLTEKLAESKGEEAVETQKLRIEIAEQNKLNKTQAKQQLKLVGAYAKAAKQLVENRKRLKDLAIEGKQASKEFIKLQKSVTKLDQELKDVDASAGQFQRNVGDYPQTMQAATNSTAAWGLALIGLNGGLGDVSTSLDANEEGSEELRKTQGKLDVVANSLQNRFSKFALNLFNASKEIISGEKNALAFMSALQGMNNVFTGLNKELDQNIDASDEANDAQIKLEKSSRALAERVAVLTGEVERQNAIAGDSTNSFDEIAVAVGLANNADLERIGILRQIAAEELKIIEDRINATADEANRRQLLDELSERRIALIELESELTVAQIERDKEAKENARDRFERELDFAIDAFDAQKTVNERQAADDRKTLEEREAIFKRTFELSEISFADQIKLVEDFTGERLNLNELVLIDDERVIRERLRQHDLDDVALGRILEIIKERKFVSQDLSDLERDLTDAVKERSQASIAAAKEQASTINDIEQAQFQGELDRLVRSADLQEEGSRERIRILEQEFELRKSKLIAQAEFELSLEETTAEQKELINQNLQNDLLALEQEQQKAVKDQRDQNNADLQKSLEEISDAIIQFISDMNEARIASLEEQITASESNIDRLEALAAQGSEDATDNLANEIQKQAELQKEKEKKIEEQKNLELTLAAIQTFASNIESGDGNALGSTIGQITALLGFIGGLSGSFFDGIEDTGTVANPLDNKGGRLTMTHDNERIMSKKDNALTGGMKNNDLAQLAYMHNHGRLVDVNRIDSAISPQSYQTNNEILSAFDDLEKAVKDNKPARESWRFDGRSEMLVHTIEKRGNIKRTHKKSSGLWA